jgi:ribonuclease T2
MLDIMPDPSLIAHEWSTHGTCSGLSAVDYFNLIRQAFNSVRIPRQFAAPSAPMTISPLQVKQAFEQSNPALRDAGIMIACPGNYLSEVEICMDKRLNAIACTAPRDCSARTIRVAPIR